MKVIGLDGKEYNLSLKYQYEYGDNKSNLHLRARTLLKEVFPFTVIYEEVHIPGTKLHVDFFIPVLDVMVEVQGEQHFKFNKYFHGGYGSITVGKTNFMRSQKNDRNKEAWAEINSIKLVYLRHDETLEEWRSKLNG